MTAAAAACGPVRERGRSGGLGPGAVAGPLVCPAPAVGDVLARRRRGHVATRRISVQGRARGAGRVRSGGAGVRLGRARAPLLRGRCSRGRRGGSGGGGTPVPGGQRLSRVCGLSDRQVVASNRTAKGWTTEQYRWVAPRLRRVRTRAHSVELKVRARAGQTLAELETGAERVATTFGAVAHRVWPVSGSTVVVQLVMVDLLNHPTTAVEPAPGVVAESVRLGRAQAGGHWQLALRGRHTLVAGCSGAGKGSVLWGICCGLAPAVRADVARLWGIDLKRGVELAMGEALFATRAYTPADALDGPPRPHGRDRRPRPDHGRHHPAARPGPGGPAARPRHRRARRPDRVRRPRRPPRSQPAPRRDPHPRPGPRGRRRRVRAGPPQGRRRHARPVHPDRRPAAAVGGGDRHGPRGRHVQGRARPPHQPGRPGDRVGRRRHRSRRPGPRRLLARPPHPPPLGGVRKPGPRRDQPASPRRPRTRPPSGATPPQGRIRA